MIGPNPIFLRYIAQVLPRCGTAARQTTLERLLAGTAYRDRRRRRRGAAKATPGWRRSSPGRWPSRRPPEDDVAVATAWGGVTVPAAALAAAVHEVARDVPHTVGRTAFRRQARLVRTQLVRRRGDEAVPAEELTRTCGATGVEPGAGPGVAALTAAGGRAPAAHQPGGLAAAAGDPGHRRAGGDRGGPPPGGRRAVDRRRPGAAGRGRGRRGGPPRAYGHIVVDEAQDLSAMAGSGHRPGAARRPR